MRPNYSPPSWRTLYCESFRKLNKRIIFLSDTHSPLTLPMTRIIEETNVIIISVTQFGEGDSGRRAGNTETTREVLVD